MTEVTKKILLVNYKLFKIKFEKVFCRVSQE